MQKQYGLVTVRSETVEKDDRSVEVMWSSGAQVKRYDWDDGFYNEELSMEPGAIRMDRFAHGMSVLDSHHERTMNSRLGTVIPGTARVENGQGYARIKFSRHPVAETIFQDLLDGHPIQISVGYRVHKFEKIVTDVSKYPTMRAVDWEPTELSIVCVPAEAGAGSRSERPVDEPNDAVLIEHLPETQTATAAISMETQMNKRDAAKSYTGDKLDILALGAGITRSASETDDALRARLIAAYDAEDAATRAAEDAANRAAEAARAEAAEAANRSLQTMSVSEQAQVATRETLAKERKRVNDIEDVARMAQIDPTDALVRTAVQNGTDVEAFRSAVLDKIIERQAQAPTFPAVETRGGRDAQETTRNMVANAVLHRAGLVDKLEDGAREWRSMTTLDIAKELLRSRGESTRGSTHQIAERALMTTSDFPIILQQITNVTVLRGYEAYQNTFHLFASRKLMSDYRDSKVIDIGSAPDLLPKNEHGEFESGSIRESQESMKLTRYGRTMGFTHEMLINDQLDAFMDAVRNWGNKAAKLEGDIVWNVVLNNTVLMNDGKPLFHADHGNLAAAGTALDIANLKAARLSFRKQKDIDGEPINLSPKYLFVGADNEVDAHTLVSVPTQPTKVEDAVPQIVKSLIPTYEPRIDKVSTKAWFLFADVAQAMGRGVHYLHLLGNENPTTAEKIGFRIEGIEFSIAHSFGAGLTDYRYAYKNPGTAK